MRRWKVFGFAAGACFLGAVALFSTSRAQTPEEQEQEIIVDPVCGMIISRSDALDAVYGDRTFYF